MANATYLEKLRAYQDLVQRMLVVEDAMARLCLALGGRAAVEQALMEFQNRAFYHKIWIGLDGVNAMREARDKLRELLDNLPPDPNGKAVASDMKLIQAKFEESLTAIIGGLPV